MSEALLFLQQLDPGDEEGKSVCSNSSSSWSESCGLAPGGLTSPPLPSCPGEEGRFPAHPQKTDAAQKWPRLRLSSPSSSEYLVRVRGLWPNIQPVCPVTATRTTAQPSLTPARWFPCRPNATSTGPILPRSWNTAAFTSAVSQRTAPSLTCSVKCWSRTPR